MTSSAVSSAAPVQSQFLRSEVVHLFPTCVWCHWLVAADRMNCRILDSLESVRAVEPSRSKAEGAWQSAGDLHRREAFAPLAKAMLAAAGRVAGFLRWQCEGLEITNLWANMNFGKHAHHQHTHPNNHISGVYYAQAEERCGDILFYDPRPQAHLMEPQIAEFTPPTMGQYRFKPEAGMMLLFPSWLEHSVEPNLSGRPRVSLAFNVVLRGRIGRESGEAVL